MSILKDSDKEQVKRELEALTGPVRLIMFTQLLECEFCEDTRKMVEEVAALSDKVTAEIYNFITDKEKVEEYGVDKIPAITVIGKRDYGLRFYGIPAGYEFTALIEAIKAASSGQSGLSEESKAALTKIDQPVHIQIFTTPT